MKFIIAVFLVALVVEVTSIDAGTRNVEVPDSIYPQNVREKRTLGVSKDEKKEWELTTKDGTSLRVSKSVSYNDGGALQMLPALLDARAKKDVKILNQLQNGKGRPEVAQQMLSEETSPIDFSTDTNIESPHTRPSRFLHPHSSTATTSVASPGVCCAPAPVVSNPTIVVHPVAVQPVVVHPVAVQPVVVQPVAVVAQVQPVVPVQTIPSHAQKFIEKLRRKEEKKQVFLGKVHALKEIIAYKKKARAQRFHEKLAAIHAIKAAKYNKCPTCCCN